MILDQDMFDACKAGARRKGQKDLLNHLQSVRLTQRQAIYAKCYDCNGMGDIDECDIVSCSLYPYSQFKTKLAKPNGGKAVATKNTKKGKV